MAMHKLGLTTRPSGARPSAYGLSAPLPGNAASSSGHMKSDKLRPDHFKLSATVQTQNSDEESRGEFATSKSNHWYAPPTVPPKDHSSKKLQRSRRDNDNESEKSLRIKSSRSSNEDQMHIMVSKSFYITDEERERASVASRGEPYR